LWRSLELKPVWGLLEKGGRCDRKSRSACAIALFISPTQ
jgi:hypothetical protein